MDLFRYSEGHGGQGDPRIPYAWRHRDYLYLIRALNDDVPYDRLIEEHVAGDLIAEPRIDRYRQLAGLTAAEAVNPATGEHPDFTRLGNTIYFGYRPTNSTGSSSGTLANAVGRRMQ